MPPLFADDDDCTEAADPLLEELLAELLLPADPDDPDELDDRDIPGELDANPPALEPGPVVPQIPAPPECGATALVMP